MKPALGFALAIVAGFAAGFVWGARTRDGLSASTRTSYSGGVLTVQVDTLAALQSGAASALSGS